MNATRRLSLPIAADQHTRLKVASAMVGEPMTTIVRRALGRELSALERKTPRTSTQETQK